MVYKDGSFDIGARIECEVASLVVCALLSEAKWRHPGALRLECLGPLSAHRCLVYKASSTTLDSEVGVEDAVLWLCETLGAELA